MQNAFNMTHPVIPQGNTFATLEYLASLGIDDNFKIPSLTGLASENYVNDTIESLNIPLLSKITLTNPVITESASLKPDTGYEITFTQNISEFRDTGYVSNANSLHVSIYFILTQNLTASGTAMPIQNTVSSSCDINKLDETHNMNIDSAILTNYIDEITCKLTSNRLTAHVKSNQPIIGGNVLQIRAEFNNKTAYKLTIGDANFNITSLQIFNSN